MTTKKITMTPKYDQESLQASFTKKKIDEKLKDYKEMKPEKWKDIEINDRMRYFSSGTFKSGGRVKRNAYPDYIVLANDMKSLSWCVQLKDPTLKIYIKSFSKMKRESDEMKKIYKDLKDGKIKIQKT